MNIIADVLQIKQLEKLLGRKLTWPEERGLKWVRVSKDHSVRVAQLSLQWIHNKNNCK